MRKYIVFVNVSGVLLFLSIVFSFQNCMSEFQIAQKKQMGMDSSEMDMGTPDASRIMLQVQGPITRSSGAVQIAFDLMDMKTNNLVASANLAHSNEKILHFIIFDSALKEFQHIHPEYQGGSWTVPAVFNVDGNYFLFAEGVLAADGTDFLSSGNLTITGGGLANPTPPMLTETRSATIGNSIVTLSEEMIASASPVQLTLKYSRTDGTEPVLSDYLGSKAHAIITPSDGRTLIHGHPVQKSATELTLHTTFPSRGMYRVWIQFIDAGVLKRADLAVEVM
jgi:hypothetical protein